MAIDAPINTGVTDLSLTRERVWRRTTGKNRANLPVLVDTGIDIVQYDGFPEGVEYGASNFELRHDGKVCDRKYTGIRIIDNDVVFNVLGPVTRTAA